MDFYSRVKQLAKKRNISLQNLILSLDINLDSYNSMRKSGNLPRADEALKIAQELGTTVEYLITGMETGTTVNNILNAFQGLINQYKEDMKK